MNSPLSSKTQSLPYSPRMLASVNSLAEAELVQAAAVDIIDLKDPHNGALGALPLDVISQIVAGLEPASVVSATIGDIDSAVADVTAAIEKVATTGVTYVKAGVDAGLDFDRLMSAIAPLTTDIKIVLVLFADRPMAAEAVKKAAGAGVHGVMLDTAGKRSANLRGCLNSHQLNEFVDSARRHGLLTGLAGSIGLDDIAPLSQLQPDYLGFRGALCAGGSRTQSIDADAVRTIRDRLNALRRRAQQPTSNKAAVVA